MNNYCQNQIKFLKIAIRTKKHEGDTLELIKLIATFRDTDVERNIFSIMLEDDFVDWLIEIIAQVQYSEDEDKRKFLKAVLSLIADGSYRSISFCVKLTSNDMFVIIMKAIISNESVIDAIKCDVVSIIANVTFNYVDTIFVDSDFKEFLIKQINSKKRLYSIITLVRLCSQQEVDELEDVFCSILPEVVENLIECSNAVIFGNQQSSIEENIQFLQALCKCKQAKKSLSENFRLLFKLRIILIMNRFKEYVSDVDQLMTVLYTPDQVRFIKEEVSISKDSIQH